MHNHGNSKLCHSATVFPNIFLFCQNLSSLALNGHRCRSAEGSIQLVLLFTITIHTAYLGYVELWVLLQMLTLTVTLLTLNIHTLVLYIYRLRPQITSTYYHSSHLHIHSSAHLSDVTRNNPFRQTVLCIK